MNKKEFEYGVIGGGINGLCTGLALVRRGLNVAIFEQFTPRNNRGSSHGQSRIVRHLVRITVRE